MYMRNKLLHLPIYCQFDDFDVGVFNAFLQYGNYDEEEEEAGINKNL